MANLQDLKFSGADYIRIPAGTTANRPSSPSAGMLRKNTDREYRPEIYDGSNWIDAISGVILDNCVLYIDAAEHLCVRDLYKSTPASNLYDLSGNGNNGTIGSGIEYRGDLTAGAVLRFDGTINAQATFTSPNLTSSNYTIIGASRYAIVSTSSAVSGRIFSGHNNNWFMGHWGNKVNMHYAEGWVTPSTGSTDNNWRIYCATGHITNDQYSFYTNDTVNVSNSTGGSGGPNGFRIGAYGPGNSGAGTEFSTAEVSFLLAYNTILSTSQISYTYNLFRNRFKYLGVAT